jgi:hypothetical protein
LRILDPACGSGSFLLGAYQYLLNWHRDWYVKDGPEKHTKELFPAQGGDWRLTTAKKKEILLNNIYGVDIDQQAVEVTKLSLLLKVLEGENEQTIQSQLKLFQERALPDLGNNIKCGNSLIGSDFYQGQQASLFDDVEERLRVNTFDWDGKDGFPDIMKAGGFDAVIGNPPWGADFSIPEQEYFRTRFRTASGRGVDSYALFIERSLRVLRSDGLLSFITPDTYLRKDDHLPLRKLLLSDSRVDELVETGPVFADVRDTWGLVFVVANSKASVGHQIRHRKISRFIVSAEERLAKFGRADWDEESTVRQSLWLKSPNLIIGYKATDEAQTIIAKMAESPSLSDLCEQYVVSRGEEGSKFALRELKSGTFSMVIPADVDRYSVADGIRVAGSSLTESKVQLLYAHPKVWCIRIQKLRWRQRVVCGFDARRNSSGMKTLQVVVSAKDDVADLMFLQGVLASQLVNYWCVNFLADDMNQSYLEKVPIPRADKARHDKIVFLVERMLKLHKDLPKARTAPDKTAIERQIAATDKQIDASVYELYGLTGEEVRIVEGS